MKFPDDLWLIDKYAELSDSDKVFVLTSIGVATTVSLRGTYDRLTEEQFRRGARYANEVIHKVLEESILLQTQRILVPNRKSILERLASDMQITEKSAEPFFDFIRDAQDSFVRLKGLP